MSVSRREFLASTAVATVAGLAGSRAVVRAWQQTPAPPPTQFVPARGGTGYFTGRGGTIGYYIADEGIVVIDSQYPVQAKLCIEGLNERSGNRRIDVLLNTHHHVDHTGGNPAFRPVTKKIVAQEKVPRLQTLAFQQASQATPPPATPPADPVFPDTTFATTWRLMLGKEIVTARYFGPAHTGGDSVVHFEKANVVHVGDLVWSKLQTYVDRPGGASATNWIKALEQIAAAYPADAMYIWGHAGAKGQVTGVKADLLTMRDYMTALVGFVRDGMKAGKSRDEIVKSTSLLKGFEDYGPLTTRALEGTYDELSIS